MNGVLIPSPRVKGFQLYGLQKNERKKVAAEKHTYWIESCCLLCHRQLFLFYVLLILQFVTPAIGICPPRCTCDEENLVATCVHAGLESVPILLNPEVRSLFLSANNIRAITTNSVHFYEYVEILDLSDNRVVSIDDNSFKHQRSLKILNLNKNQVADLEGSAFKGLSSLLVLTLSDNLLENLSPRVFHHLGSLQELDLSRNQLASIADNALDGLSSLRTLKLADNKLKQVPTSALRGVGKSLLQLDLAMNTFQLIDDNAFVALQKVEALNLDGCRIHSFSEGAFRGLEQLRELRVRDNALNLLPSITEWQYLHRLETVYIGQNPYNEVPANAFEGLSRLMHLEIIGSRNLTMIKQKAFSANAELQMVVISHNPILSTLESDAFHGLSNLRQLSLRGNAFNTFAENWLPWDELSTLDVRDNPLDCNCSLAWLVSLLRTRNISLDVNGYAAAAKCSSPLQLADRLLTDLVDSNLSCQTTGDYEVLVIALVVLFTLLFLGLLVCLAWHFHPWFLGLFKEKPWSNGSLQHKDIYYEKTQDDEALDPNILQAAQHPLKMTPVTEL